MDGCVRHGSTSGKGKGGFGGFLSHWFEWRFECILQLFQGKITHRSNFAASRLCAMWHWHCVVGVSYPWLNDWTRLQWALHS